MRFGKRKDIIAIDLSGDEFILAHFKPSHRRGEFVDLITYKIKGTADDDIAKMVKNTFKDLKVKKPHIINVAPLHLAITKNLEIPSLDDQEIRKIVELQSSRQTPYAREEIIIDHIKIGTYKQSYTKILLVIVTRAAIKRQFDIMSKAGFKIEDMFFAPEGISRICLPQLKGELANSPAGIVHIDSDSTDFIVSLKGVPIFTRSLPLGVNHFTTEKDKFTLKFIEELKSSLETYQSEDIDAAPQVLLLTGALEPVKDLEPILNAELQTPIQIVPYFKSLPLNSKVSTVPTISGHLSFLNVTSIALAAKEMNVNLIPDEIKLQRTFEKRAFELIKMGVNIVCLFVLFGGIFGSKLYFENTHQNRLKALYESTKEEARILEKAMERTRIVKYYLKKRGYSLQVLAAMYDILPKRIMLTDIKMDTEKNLYLKGTARAMSDVFSFVVSLEESVYFSNVKTNYTTSRKQDDEDWADFGITCILAEN